MVKRRLGLALVVIVAVVSAAGAAYASFHFDALIAQERVSIDTFNRTIQTAHVSLANLRGAQAAYFAVGQGPDFWPKRAGELAAELEHTIGSLHAGTSSAAARAHYESAVSALGSLNSLDQKARDDIEIGETRAAANTVFSEGTTTTESLASALNGAQSEEQIVRDARVSNLLRQRVQYASAGIAALLVIGLALAFTRRQTGQASEDAPVSIVERVAPAPAPVVQAAPPIPTPSPSTSSSTSPTPSSSPSSSENDRRVDLSNAAQICVDFARVLDGKDIQPILQRAAEALGARGLVLWVADVGGAMLRPSLAHGYPEKVLQRLGPLPADADNVTSLAFRSMQVQTVGDAKASASAFAVPLITSTGCIGVLAAEVALGQARAESLPVARMFAAQLATLVAPAEAASVKAAPAEAAPARQAAAQ